MAAAVKERRAKAPPVAEFRRALETALAEADSDEPAGAVLRATKMKVRFSFPDVGMVLNVCAGERQETLEWAFSDDVDWEPKLELEMDSSVANNYLQERESIAVAIARGKVRSRGDAKTAIVYLPALRLLARPYRRVVSKDYPRLALD
jgi:hypothetical protein